MNKQTNQPQISGCASAHTRELSTLSGKSTVTTKRVRVMIDTGGGLEFRHWYQAYLNGNPMGHPQATSKLAKNWAISKLSHISVNALEQQTASATPDSYANTALPKLRSAKKRATESKQAPQTWGAFDADGKLRATFDSESEAYFYVRNRGHMHNGTHRPIADKSAVALAKAEKLAEALRQIMFGLGGNWHIVSEWEASK